MIKMNLNFKTLSQLIQPTNHHCSIAAAFSKVIPSRKTLKMNTLKHEEVRNYQRLKP